MAVALQSFPHSLPHSHTFQLRSSSMDQPRNTRPSLPSISSLIEAVNDQTETANETSPKTESARRISGGSQGQPATSPDRPSLVGSPRSHPPPTPELPPTSSFHFHRSVDGNTSPTSGAARASYYPRTPSSTSPEFYAQRGSNYPPVPEANSSYPPLPDTNQWPPPPQQPQPPAQPTNLQASQPVAPSKTEPPAESSQYSGLPQQRPLPGNFPPPLPGHGLPPIDPQMAPAWQQQHHHYYPPANPPSYPQTQERYICPTCSKPFSRPSSLKIHTYSHTGEKPYKCKHEGCGKHFSVRSNMKRHEKGCHGGESASTSGNSPKTA